MASAAEIRKCFSVKRKPDVITALALTLFFIMIAFQIYLIVFLPVQIKKAEMLEINIMQEQLLLDMDDLRRSFRYVVFRNVLNRGEMEFIQETCDQVAAFLREYADDLTLSQLGEASRTIRMLNSAVDRGIYHARSGLRFADWNPRFSLQKEEIDQEKYVRMLDERIRKQEQIVP